jgi:hypothetical protein
MPAAQELSNEIELGHWDLEEFEYHRYAAPPTADEGEEPPIPE